MFNVTNLHRFLLVACPCLQRILLHFTIQSLCTYYILYPEHKTFTNYYTLFPLHYKKLCPWEVCSIDDPWSFAASNSFMHSIHQCTWKSLQFFIIIIMMATFMRVS